MLHSFQQLGCCSSSFPLFSTFERRSNLGFKDHLHAGCHHLHPPSLQFLLTPTLLQFRHFFSLFEFALHCIPEFMPPFLQPSNHRHSPDCASSAKLTHNLVQLCLHAAPPLLSAKSLLCRLWTPGASSAGAHRWSGASWADSLHFTLAVWSAFRCGGQAETVVGASASSLSQQSNYGDI